MFRNDRFGPPRGIKDRVREWGENSLNIRPIVIILILIILASFYGGFELSKSRYQYQAPAYSPGVSSPEISFNPGNIDRSVAPCYTCHDREIIERLHIVEIIAEIDLSRDRQPTLCTSCHGQKVHTIHRDLLKKNSITCQSCHEEEGEIKGIEIPPGRIIVCVICHGDGNYLEIHERRCDYCHIINLKETHLDLLKDWSSIYPQFVRINSTEMENN